MENLLNQILMIALKHHVTDIHFSLLEDDTVTIDMRVNGIIRRLKPNGENGSFFRYLMYRANLDLSDAFEPQTGRFETLIGNQKLSLRFALVSSYHITSGVLRILNNHEELTIQELSTNEEDIQWMKEIGNHRAGLYVFSGPTGSGKTTTLYTILNAIEGKKIYTLEDPIEIFSEKYVQLSINEKAHFSYADGIKQLMRHDPDIVMIGEIRDDVAAAMAVRCALTGHLVITSIHSNSCINAIERLKDLGVSSMQLEDVLCGISCQRLYDTNDQKKVGVYEIMNRKELDYYFSHETTSSNFTCLQDAIQLAIEKGSISPQQAKQDIA